MGPAVVPLAEVEVAALACARVVTGMSSLTAPPEMARRWNPWEESDDDMEVD